MSNLEEMIMKVLKKDKVYYEREKTFQDLRQGKYRFDFYCPYAPGGPSVIEVQGPQHYYQIAKFHKTRQEFLSAKERDRRKINYCLGNGIRLYCIPYWDIKCISCADQIFSTKYRAVSQWKNDNDWKEFSKK